MTIKELKEHLNEFSDDSLEVMILDGFNGGGRKRKINLTPSSTEKISVQDEQEGADCRGKVGNKVVILGYGCY